jgi:hypothetical protein
MLMFEPISANFMSTGILCKILFTYNLQCSVALVS